MSRYLTEEHEIFRKAIRRFLEKEAARLPFLLQSGRFYDIMVVSVYREDAHG